MAGAQTMQVRIVAQDPSIRVDGKILTDLVSFPAEELDAGPTGHRVQVVDYDASSRTLYKAARAAGLTDEATDDLILGDPGFHARNTYGLVMTTLARFELALGRRVEWGFSAHQLKIVPHAFAVANAFFAPDAEALLFGYFERPSTRRRARPERVYTCLSHDIVVHETAHALLHGLRPRFMQPSSPDQAAFHEGFGDIVALLSVFRMPGVVSRLIDRSVKDQMARPPSAGLVNTAALSFEHLRDSALSGLAEDFVDEEPTRRGALRRSVAIEPNNKILEQLEFKEAHRRGEVLVAAVMRAFIDVWTRRLAALAPERARFVDRQRATEEGANIADQLLTMFIRAIDYTQPVHLDFSDFLTAVLTGDRELRVDDSKYRLRDTLRDWFGRYGIPPAEGADRDGCWPYRDEHLVRSGVRFSSLQSDPTEMFRLIWANRTPLGLPGYAYSCVEEVRPCLRTEPEDGLPVRETVAQWRQYVRLPAAELPSYGLRAPVGMAPDELVVLEGGSTLVLDEYGVLKFQISNSLPDPKQPGSRVHVKTQERLDHLFETGAFAPGAAARTGIARVHRRRVNEPVPNRQEVW